MPCVFPACAGDCCKINANKLPPLAGKFLASIVAELTEGTSILKVTLNKLRNFSHDKGGWGEQLSHAWGTLLGDRLFRQTKLFSTLFHAGPRLQLCPDPGVFANGRGISTGLRAAAKKHCARDFVASKTDVYYLDTDIFYGYTPNCYRCGANVSREGWCPDLKRVATSADGRTLFIQSALYRCRGCCGDPGTRFPVTCRMFGTFAFLP
jgi:hypothetical protein